MIELVRSMAGQIHGVMQQAQDLDDSFPGSFDGTEQDDMSAASNAAAKWSMGSRWVTR